VIRNLAIMQIIMLTQIELFSIRLTSYIVILFLRLVVQDYQPYLLFTERIVYMGNMKCNGLLSFFKSLQENFSNDCAFVAVWDYQSAAFII